MSEKASKESQYSFTPLHPPKRGEGGDINAATRQRKTNYHTKTTQTTRRNKMTTKNKLKNQIYVEGPLY